MNQRPWTYNGIEIIVNTKAAYDQYRAYVAGVWVTAATLSGLIKAINGKLEKAA